MAASLRNFLGTSWQDLRYGVRLLAKEPGFTLVAIVTLGAGVGANTTVFAWINATLLAPVPGITDTRGLVAFASRAHSDVAPPPLSYLDYVDVREQGRSFSGLAAYHDDWLTLTGGDEAERVYGALTSADYFDVLGVQPILGRGFLPREELEPEGAPVVVISHRLWMSRFAGSASVLGSTLTVNRRPYTVVGVAPPRFQGAKTGLRTDVWIPVVMARSVWSVEQLADRGNTWLNVVGRLETGVPRDRAQDEVDGLMEQLAERHPEAHRAGHRIALHPLWSSPVGANSVLHVILPTLMAMAGLVLMLTGANVTGLVLVRSTGRQHEVALRQAIGASRGRLVRQYLAEGLVLGLAAGVVGLMLTAWTAGALASSFLPAIHWPLALDVPIDPTVVLVTLGLSVLAGVAIGLLPALRASRLSPAVLMKQEARTVAGGLYRSRLGRGLVVGQVALSVLLLISAGLFVRSAVNAHRFRPGFEVGSVLLATLDLLPAGYSPTEGVELDRALLARIEALPGVESATLSDWVPLSFRSHTSVIEPEGYAAAPSESMEIGRANVGPGFLRTLRIPLVAGRDLTLLDGRETPRVALVNETLAGRYWPGESAVGKRIRADANWYTVVGVARDSKYESLTEGAVPFIFLPLLQNYYPEATLYVRVAGAPLDYAAAVREAVAALDPSLPVFDVTTLEARTGAAGFHSRMAGTIVGVFGLLALLLATVGIYGVVAHTIRQRTREVGIRVALGADPAAVQRLVLAQGVRLAVLGVTLGVGLALVLTRFIRAQLFGLTSTDPATFLAVAALLGVVAGLACWLPARRATRLDPMVALGRD